MNETKTNMMNDHDLKNLSIGMMNGNDAIALAKDRDDLKVRLERAENVSLNLYVVLDELCHQIAINDFKDSLGHQAKMLTPYFAASKMMAQLATRSVVLREVDGFKEKIAKLESSISSHVWLLKKIREGNLVAINLPENLKKSMDAMLDSDEAKKNPFNPSPEENFAYLQQCRIVALEAELDTEHNKSGRFLSKINTLVEQNQMFVQQIDSLQARLDAERAKIKILEIGKELGTAPSWEEMFNEERERSNRIQSDRNQDASDFHDERKQMRREIEELKGKKDSSDRKVEGLYGRIKNLNKMFDNTGKVGRLAKVLQDLLNRLDFIHGHPSYQAVWVSFNNHNGPYVGPIYAEEFDRAKEEMASFKKSEKEKFIKECKTMHEEF